MTKAEALSHFGDETVPDAQRIQALADFLGMSRTAFYMWPDDQPIPPRRQLQIENGMLTGRLPMPIVGGEQRPAA